MEVQLHIFLSLALHGDEAEIARVRLFTPGERTPPPQYGLYVRLNDPRT